jgi:hypothetical protein
MHENDRYHLTAYGEPAQLGQEKQVFLVGRIRLENDRGSW